MVGILCAAAAAAALGVALGLSPLLFRLLVDPVVEAGAVSEILSVLFCL